MKKQLVLMLVFVGMGSLFAQKTASQFEIDKLYYKAIELKNSQPQEALVHLSEALQISAQNKYYIHGKLALAFGDQWLRISAYDSASKYYQIAENHLTEQDVELSFVYNFAYNPQLSRNYYLKQPLN